MTDVSTPGVTPPPGDRLVYVPLDALPKELLGKLGDFKVIVKDDKAGDRIHPKERLGEVLAELNRENNNNNASVTHLNESDYCNVIGRNINSRTPPSLPDTTANQTEAPGIRSNPPSPGVPSSPKTLSQTLPPFSVGKRRMAEIDNESQNRFSVHHEHSNDSYFRNVAKSPVYDNENVDVYPEPNYDSRSEARVSMEPGHVQQIQQAYLETTPRKRNTILEEPMLNVLLRKNSRCDESGSWDYVRRSRSVREFPTPSDVSMAAPYGRADDVTSARKQLFNSPPVNRHRSEHDSDYDLQKENYYHSRRSPRPRPYLSFTEDTDMGSPVSPGCSRDECVSSPSRGYKRKQVFDDDRDFTTPYQRAESPKDARMPSSAGMGDYLMEMLNPAKRQCYDYSDIGPSRNRQYKVKCACSMMETHFLQMTECAYRNIRRKDSSRESFEQFNRELSQTNSVLKESVDILRAIQQICTHRDVHGERLR